MQMTDSLLKIPRATEMAIMILHICNCNHSSWISQIPPLIPKTPLFGTEQELPVVTPILTFEYFNTSATARFSTLNCWYNGDLSSHPLYFDVVDSPNKQGNVGWYILNIASDLSAPSLIPTTNHVPMPILNYAIYLNHTAYRICENSSMNVSSKHGGNQAIQTLSCFSIN